MRFFNQELHALKFNIDHTVHTAEPLGEVTPEIENRFAYAVELLKLPLAKKPKEPPAHFKPKPEDGGGEGEVAKNLPPKKTAKAPKAETGKPNAPAGENAKDDGTQPPAGSTEGAKDDPGAGAGSGSDTAGAEGADGKTGEPATAGATGGSGAADTSTPPATQPNARGGRRASTPPQDNK